jgi:hypothetical protein
MYTLNMNIMNQFNEWKTDINMKIIYMEQTLNLMAAQDLAEVKALVASGITKEIETGKYIVIITQ